jgi:hypothetical protein
MNEREAQLQPDEAEAEYATHRDLAWLRAEWGHAYVVWYQAGQFCGCRRDNGAICRRGNADDLRKELDADYRAHPVLL